MREYHRVWNALDERERLTFDLVTFCGLRGSEVYVLRSGDLYEQGATRVEQSFYKGDINPTKTDRPRNVGVDKEIFGRLTAWIATLPDRSRTGWVFPRERIVSPFLPDNVLRRCVYRRLAPLGLDWVNFAVLRRTPSSLRQTRRTDPKIIADQQGHGLGVHMSDYVDSSMAQKREASSALWGISKPFPQFLQFLIETNETNADLVGFASY